MGLSKTWKCVCEICSFSASGKPQRMPTEEYLKEQGWVCSFDMWFCSMECRDEWVQKFKGTTKFRGNRQKSDKYFPNAAITRRGISKAVVVTENKDGTKTTSTVWQFPESLINALPKGVK